MDGEEEVMSEWDQQWDIWWAARKNVIMLALQEASTWYEAEAPGSPEPDIDKRRDAVQNELDAAIQQMFHEQLKLVCIESDSDPDDDD